VLELKCKIYGASYHNSFPEFLGLGKDDPLEHFVLFSEFFLVFLLSTSFAQKFFICFVSFEEFFSPHSLRLTNIFLGSLHSFHAQFDN
jgi:hypothetical protein